MVRYFFAWIPIVIVGIVFILALPWLGLVALMAAALVALVALAALGSAIVLVACRLGRALTRGWHRRRGASPRPASVETVYEHSFAYAAPRLIDYPTSQLSHSTRSTITARERDGLS